VLWDMISLGVLLGFNLTNTSLIMVRYGNGGELRAPGVAKLVCGFWVVAAIGAYTLYKGFLVLMLEGQPWQPWAPMVAGASLLAAALLLLLVARHEEHPADDLAALIRTPAVPFLPGLAMVVNFTLMATISWQDHFYMLCAIVASLAVYASTGVRAALSRNSSSSKEVDSGNTEAAHDQVDLA